VGGNGTNGSDYNSLTGSVVIAAGATSAVLPINIIDDNLIEGNETAVVTLLSSNAYTVGAANSATVTIADNDSTVVNIGTNQTLSGTLSTTDPSNPTRSGTYRDDYALTGVIVGQPVKVSLNSSFDNYLQIINAATGQVVAENDDANGTNNAEVTFTPVSGVNYLLRATSFSGGATGSYTISTSSVAPATVSITATDANAAETVTGQTTDPGQFTITRSGSTASALTVNYSVGGNGTNGSDYNSLTGSVVIAAGATSAVLPINIIDDNLIEGNETAVVTLLSSNAYTVGAANSATVTIADNDSTNPPTPATISNLLFSGTEGDTGTFQIRLNQAPTSNVTVSFNAGSFFTIDADGIVSNGTQNTITFTSANWNQPRTVWFIAENDSSSADRTSGNTISYTLSGSQTGSGTYNLGTIVNTYAPDNNHFNIDLDFRNDHLGFWTSERRLIAQRAANDWANLIANELGGLTLSNQIFGQVGANGTSAFNFTTNRFVDDLVIFAGAYTGDPWGGWGGPLTATNSSNPLPRVGGITANVSASWNNSSIYSLVSHEIGHALGLIGLNFTGSQLISGNSFTGSFSRTYNGGNNIPVGEDGTAHPNRNIVSMMSYGHTYNLSAPSELDKRLLADHGYQVFGINASTIAPSLAPVSSSIEVAPRFVACKCSSCMPASRSNTRRTSSLNMLGYSRLADLIEVD
jgi:hypothetical protein